MAPPPPSPSSLIAAIDEILDIQRQRAIEYASFHSGFRLHLKNTSSSNSSIHIYRQLTASLTPRFQSLSQQALAVEALLRDVLHRMDVADVVRRIQDAEKEKLEMTLALHALRSASAVQQKQHDDHHHHHSHHHNCGGGVEGDDDDDVSSKENEIKNAIQETYVSLEECVGTINDAISELHQLKQDTSDPDL